jgi:hypothetical protein
VGGVGGYNTANIHADVKHAFIMSDARKLAQTLRTQLITPIVELNITRLADLFGASPDEIRACVPALHWRLEREVSPSQRKDIVIAAGLRSVNQVRDEFGLDAPKPGGKSIAGEPQQVGSGGLVGSLEAATAGAEPPPKEGAAPAPNAAPVATGEATNTSTTAPDAGAPPNRPATDSAQADEKPSTAKE